MVMRPPKDFPLGTAARMKELLRQEAGSVADQRRIQAVLMRALDASRPERIAEVTGLSVTTGGGGHELRDLQQAS
ncbi:MAG: hypothetical protein RIQ79_2057 [Verrucomicrobiota bacterium]